MDLKRKSSIISINNTLETQKKTVKDEASKYELRKNNFSELKLFETWKDLILYVKNQGKSNLVTSLERYCLQEFNFNIISSSIIFS